MPVVFRFVDAAKAGTNGLLNNISGGAAQPATGTQ